MRSDILYGIGILLAASGVQAHDGRVYVSGTITDNTCSLSPGSENINVAMGGGFSTAVLSRRRRFSLATFCHRFTELRQHCQRRNGQF